jgi:ABC-type multidrug transport system ATPase subunit
VIEIRHLSKRFGEVPAVEDLSLMIQPGEAFALLGPNGSGKTTALKCVVGLTRPTSGEVLVSGIDPWKRPREARRLLSYLPQRVSFHENLTGREILEFYCKLRKLPPGRVGQVMAAEGLNVNGFIDRPVNGLSGGMIQRLGIAVATLPDTPVLVLDEPGISLDPAGAIEFRRLIAGLRAQGKTVVFSSHVLGEVELLADRAALLVGGRLLAVESVAALRGGTASGARMCLRLRNPEERFAGAALDAGAACAELVRETLVVSCKPAERLCVARAIEAAGASIEHLSTEEPSLEEIYLRYVDEKGTAGSPDADDGLRKRTSQAG